MSAHNKKHIVTDSADHEGSTNIGDAGKFLQTDGAGGLAWATAGGAGITAFANYAAFNAAIATITAGSWYSITDTWNGIAGTLYVFATSVGQFAEQAIFSQTSISPVENDSVLINNQTLLTTTTGVIIYREDVRENKIYGASNIGSFRWGTASVVGNEMDATCYMIFGASPTTLVVSYNKLSNTSGLDVSGFIASASPSIVRGNILKNGSTIIQDSINTPNSVGTIERNTLDKSTIYNNDMQNLVGTASPTHRIISDNILTGAFSGIFENKIATNTINVVECASAANGATITGLTSGATATVIQVGYTGKKLYLKNVVGAFILGESITDGSNTYTTTTALITCRNVHYFIQSNETSNPNRISFNVFANEKTANNRIVRFNCQRNINPMFDSSLFQVEPTCTRTISLASFEENTFMLNVGLRSCEIGASNHDLTQTWFSVTSNIFEDDITNSTFRTTGAADTQNIHKNNINHPLGNAISKVVYDYNITTIVGSFLPNSTLTGSLGGGAYVNFYNYTKIRVEAISTFFQIGEIITDGATGATAVISSVGTPVSISGSIGSFTLSQLNPSNENAVITLDTELSNQLFFGVLSPKESNLTRTVTSSNYDSGTNTLLLSHDFVGIGVVVINTPMTINKIELQSLGSFNTIPSFKLIPANGVSVTINGTLASLITPTSDNIVLESTTPIILDGNHDDYLELEVIRVNDGVNDNIVLGQKNASVKA